MWQWEWTLYTGRKHRYSILLELSKHRVMLGIGLEHWSDWSGVMLYLGPLAIGIGIQHGGFSWGKFKEVDP